MSLDSKRNKTSSTYYFEFGNSEQISGDISTDRHRANTKVEDETNLLNEGKRFRHLELGIFLTPDPLEYVDGFNPYIYCSQNPWGRWDPEGLKIHVKEGKDKNETSIKRKIALENVQKFTDDKLGYDKKGNIIIMDRAKEGNKLKGTMLVAELINSRKTVTIEIDFNKSSEEVADEEMTRKGKPTDSNVVFNPNMIAKVVTYNKEKQRHEMTQIPSEIILAHELIHALRSMSGDAMPLNYKARNRYKYGRVSFGRKNTMNREAIHNEEYPIEELETSGLMDPVYRPRPILGGLFYRKKPPIVKINENDIRMENNYPRRLSYEGETE